MGRALGLPAGILLGCAFALAASGSAPSAARAQSCGPPASSTSDDSSSDDSDDSDDDSSSDTGTGDVIGAVASAFAGGSSDSDGDEDAGPAGCVDSTDVTGFERCSRFGDGWNAAGWPPLRFDLGASARRISLAGVSFGGLVYHDGNPHTYELRADDLADPSVWVGSFDLRVTGAIGDHLLLGGEISAFTGGAPSGAITRDDWTLEAGRVSGFGGGLVGGIVVPLGPFRVRGEVLAGGRALFVSAVSTIGDCVSTDEQIVSRWVVEPRLAVEWFVTPWMSVEAWGGADVVDLGTAAFGLRLDFHTRSYDGTTTE
jgi:hypothetical protein